MIYAPNKCYRLMMEYFCRFKTKDNCLTFFNEGSSRSGKTFDAFDFIIDICFISRRPLAVYVFRDTLTSCRESTFRDFKEKMILRGLWREDRIFSENARPEFRIGGHTIYFRGLDKMDINEGFQSDIIFINELLSGISEEQYKNITLRCKSLVIADWNPRYAEHWAYTYEGRPNVFFTHTTFKDNRHCPPAVKARIEALEPIEANILAGTADEYRWKVYGLGIRAAAEGLIFPNAKPIDSFPDDLEHTILGLDFGFTNDPTALALTGVKGFNLYIQELFYSPVEDPWLLCDLMEPHFTGGRYAYADSADKYAKNPIGMIQAMQQRGMFVTPVKKINDSVMIGIQEMQKYRIHYVNTKNMAAEANSYCWMKVHGISVNYPEDKNNHLWDAVRYTILNEWRYYSW